MASTRRPRARRCGSEPPSCRCAPGSSSASPSEGRVMKASDVRAMSADQLQDELVKLKKEQFNLRFQRATGQLENTARVRIVHRDSTRIQTIDADTRAAEGKR